MNTYQVDGPWPGRLAIVTRPRGGESFAEDLRQIRNLGFDLLVSLLTTAEVSEFYLGREAEESKQCDLEFRSLPIPDLGVPRSADDFRKLVDDLSDALDAGKSVAIHCRQGIGRSGLLVAALLVASGLNPKVAIERVSDARGLPVPETGEQRQWIMQFAEEFVDTLAREMIIAD